MEIVPFKIDHIEAAKKLTDVLIGQDYYTTSELNQKQKQSIKEGLNCSFVLMDGDSVLGIRLTFPAEQWQKGKGEALTEDRWPHPKAETAYFQSLFLAPEIRGQGWGKKLSDQAIEQLKKLKTKGIVCHSWKESPQNSSFRYLSALGFQMIAEHSQYWKKVDYICPHCGQPCLCTAQEMYLDLNLPEPSS